MTLTTRAIFLAALGPLALLIPGMFRARKRAE